MNSFEQQDEKKFWTFKTGLLGALMLIIGISIGFFGPFLLQQDNKEISRSIKALTAINDVETKEIPNDLGLCAEPIEYSIGKIDGRFYLTKMQVRINALIASRVWNDVFDQEIIIYNPDADLTINLVYDERQEASDERKRIQGQLSFSSDRIRLKRNQLNDLYQEFVKDKASFNAAKDEFTDKISSFNASGGIPSSKISELESDQETLKGLMVELKNKADIINSKSADLRGDIVEHNQNVDRLNQLADDEDVNVGLYEEDYEADSRTITVYMFSDELDLRHTLAHEMGHALGMDHVDEDNSLMNAVFYETQESLKLSSDDLAELYVACQID
jgi:uncharacterized protein YfcZ (UPF0381/DUF406 family)